MIILPRQARDKHRESTQKRGIFLQRFETYGFEPSIIQIWQETWVSTFATVAERKERATICFVGDSHQRVLAVTARELISAVGSDNGGTTLSKRTKSKEVLRTTR